MKNIIFCVLQVIVVFVLYPTEIIAQDSAIYSIALTTSWNSTDHSAEGAIPIPGSAHWSNLVGATHQVEDEFFKLGTLATAGIEDVAELGVNTTFFNEVTAAINLGRADQWLEKSFSPVLGAIGTADLGDVTINKEFPLLSLVSMIAPSPDWFIGVNSFSFLDNDDQWKTGSISIDLYAYDAGTEDGTSYTTSNPESSPQQNISNLTNIAPFNDQKLGTLTITFISSLSVDGAVFGNAITLYPNPTSDQLYLLNPSNQAIQSIEIYSALGALVLEKAAPEKVDLSTLKGGIYYAKIRGTYGGISTRKIVKY